MQTSAKLESASQLVDRYFAALGSKPYRFQRSAWRAFRNGHSGLIHSATGTGKTLAAWLGPIMQWLDENRDEVRTTSQTPPIQALWITPLRALAGDTEKSLRHPIEALKLPWKLESRTGDSSSSLKARQLKRLPTALITTPESLSLMLTHESLLPQLMGLKSVVVDEWHELIGSKRGVQTELALARLRRLCPKLQIWGVSATLGNLQQAASVLLGADADLGETCIIRGYQKKKTHLQSLIPSTMERFPWSGHIGTRMVPQVLQLLNSANSALVFANTRSQTEIWYQEMLKQHPDWAGRIALHHGSLDSKVRKWVEDGLRTGRLRAVVCTSSLDLGVDFTAVDLVIQVGSPKGIARLLQRAGRSGHQRDAISRLAFVPTNAIELIELAAAQTAIQEGFLESRVPLEKPLDVLAQHVLTVAIGGGFEPDSLLKEIRSTFAYQSLTDREWKWILDFVQRGGSSLAAYPEFRKVEIIDGSYRISDRRMIRNHRMNIGTIVSDAAMRVKYVSGGVLGTAEENFLSKLNAGDKFVFAGRLLQLIRIHDDTALVRRATGKPDAVPRWMGGRMPLSSELSQVLRRKIEEASDGSLLGREMNALQGLFEIQRRWSRIPRADQLLIERIKTRSGYQVFLFPFEGRLVHEGLAALFAYRIAQRCQITLSMACNDYGLVLQSAKPIPIESAIEQGLFSVCELEADILASLNATEMAKRQFRQIARVAGLIQQGFPGQRKPARQLQASSNMFYDVFTNYDPENLLLAQSTREVLDQQLEIERTFEALSRIESGQIFVEDPPKVTPLAFPLMVDKLRERLSSESLAERIRRMQAELEKAAQTL
ncbi:MAG: ligase-associated DNA damage response DEXH box helicase [bacterium]|nr:ligase-associated DNA damage response DEXH box helicase [bacterium]